jgi:hypothetical protein
VPPSLFVPAPELLLDPIPPCLDDALVGPLTRRLFVGESGGNTRTLSAMVAMVAMDGGAASTGIAGVGCRSSAGAGGLKLGAIEGGTISVGASPALGASSITNPPAPSGENATPISDLPRPACGVDDKDDQPTRVSRLAWSTSEKYSALRDMPHPGIL